MPTKQRALAALAADGHVDPSWRVAPFAYHNHGCFEANGQSKCWHEPMHVLDKRESTSGFSCRSLGKSFGMLANYVALCEVHEDPLDVWQTRALVCSVHANDLCGSEDKLKLRASAIGMDLLVLTDFATYNWVDDDAERRVILVIKPLQPMAFATFEKTFRFWLLCNVVDSSKPSEMCMRLAPNVLPPGMAKPELQFFNLLRDHSPSAVTLGLHGETAKRAKRACPGACSFVKSATLAHLWERFRAVA